MSELSQRLEPGRDRMRANAIAVADREERRPFFTPKTLAAYLSISDRTARQLIADRVLPSVKIAGVRRIPAEAVDRYIAEHTDEAR